MQIYHKFCENQRKIYYVMQYLIIIQFLDFGRERRIYRMTGKLLVFKVLRIPESQMKIILNTPYNLLQSLYAHNNNLNHDYSTLVSKQMNINRNLQSIVNLRLVCCHQVFQQPHFHTHTNLVLICQLQIFNSGYNINYILRNLFGQFKIRL